MAQTKNGAKIVAAKHQGITLSQYESNLSNGLLWCTGCKKWHIKNDFGKDSSRTSGYAATCLEYRQERGKRLYVHKPKISRKGCRFSIPRSGDKLQARHRANHLVDIGIIPDPNSVPCADCGHKHKKGEGRHEYHHESYAADKQEIVIALCSKCHAKRHILNGTWGKKAKSV
jgi:hypothetical protein